MTKFIAILVAFFAFIGTAVAGDYGACETDLTWLLSQGGAISKVTDLKQDRIRLIDTYTYEFGTTWTQFIIDMGTGEDEQLDDIKETLVQMDAEAEAAKNGQMWYLVVKRELVRGAEHAIFTDLLDKTKTTPWIPFYAFVEGDRCIYGSIDWAIFEDELPEGIRSQLQ